jgi:hypothetical protein
VCSIFTSRAKRAGSGASVVAEAVTAAMLRPGRTSHARKSVTPPSRNRHETVTSDVGTLSAPDGHPLNQAVPDTVV